MARLDIEIVNRRLAKSRALAQSYIAESKVLVNDIVVDKASKDVKASDKIIVTNTLRYVSRGGLKLEKAFEVFMNSGPTPTIPPREGVAPGAFASPSLPLGERSALTGMNCLDIGSSTGGFVDCLLQHGASHVTAVDVGSNQLYASLREDKRVTLYENMDVREFKPHPQPLSEGEGEKFDIITIDVSFISLTKIIPYLAAFCEAKRSKVIALVKPQFEVGRGNLNRNGIVKTVDAKGNDISDQVYGDVINNVRKSFEDHGFTYIGRIDSPIAGGDGNREFLMCVEF